MGSGLPKAVEKGSEVQGSEVQGSEVQGSKVQGSEVQGSEVQGSEVQRSRFWVQGGNLQSAHTKGILSSS